MGLGVGIVLIAVGAILTWAVSAEVSGVDIQVVGVILLVVGIAAVLLSLLFWSSWAGPGGFSRRRTTYTGDAGERRAAVVEEDRM